MHSRSGMYPSVIVALGFRLQVCMPRGAGAEAEEKSAGGGSSRGGRGPKLGTGQTSKCQQEDRDWRHPYLDTPMRSRIVAEM
jgi:hypothetical protein